jgi:hypothetical protein
MADGADEEKWLGVRHGGVTTDGMFNSTPWKLQRAVVATKNTLKRRGSGGNLGNWMIHGNETGLVLG